MSAISRLILNADAKGRYLNSGEMDCIKSFMKSGALRLRLVKALTDSGDRTIVKQAAKQLFQNC